MKKEYSETNWFYNDFLTEFDTAKIRFSFFSYYVILWPYLMNAGTVLTSAINTMLRTMGEEKENQLQYVCMHVNAVQFIFKEKDFFSYNISCTYE